MAIAQTPALERKLVILLLCAALPSAIGLIVLMIITQQSIYLTALIGLILLLSIGYCAVMIVVRSNFVFRTLSNLLESMTQGDYSLRGRTSDANSAFGELMMQMNTLSETLANQRREVKEKQLLLSKIINQIDVAIIAINEENMITLANPCAAGLFEQSVEQFNGQSAISLKLDELVNHINAATDSSQSPPTIAYQFPARQGQFTIRCDKFIENNQTQQLLFITDVKALLRSEERKTWQNLVRVLSHEINNSLTPISSISQTLIKLSNNADSEDTSSDVVDGLTIIQERASSLKSFIDSYRELSALPKATRQKVAIKPLFNQVIQCFAHRTINLSVDEDLSVSIDPVQIERLLINLIKNADEAMPAKTGVIDIACRDKQQNNGDNKLLINIKDQGPGLANTDNLFTPFYTTKAKGSGIGLVLCRQIVETHQGDLHLDNICQQDGTIEGCEVCIELRV